MKYLYKLLSLLLVGTVLYHRVAMQEPTRVRGKKAKRPNPARKAAKKKKEKKKAAKASRRRNAMKAKRKARRSLRRAA